jgi:hypothetical protein
LGTSSSNKQHASGRLHSSAQALKGATYSVPGSGTSPNTACTGPREYLAGDCQCLPAATCTAPLACWRPAHLASQGAATHSQLNATHTHPAIQIHTYAALAPKAPAL